MRKYKFTKGKTFLVAVGTLGLIAFIYIIYSNQISADVLFGNQDYVLFAKPTFDNVYNDTVPEKKEIIGQNGLETFAARGEREPVTFSVRSNKDIGNVKIAISDLSSTSQAIIPSDNIQIYNVKNWNQCKLENQYNCLKEGSSFETPELLIKDAEQDIISEEPGWNGDKYIPPSLNQTFNVNVEKDKTHTFYLSVEIPEATEPGVFKGKISFLPTQSKGYTFDLTVEVLPFSLADLKKDNLVYYIHETAVNSAGNNRERVVSRETYRKYLELFKRDGANGLIIYQSVNEEVKWTADQMKDIGYDGKVVLIGSYWGPGDLNIREQKEYFENLGFDVYFYGKDEPYSIEKMKEHLEISKKIHDSGAKVLTAVRKECSDCLHDPNNFLYKNEPESGWQGERYKPTETIDIPLYSAVNTTGEWCVNAGDASYKKYTWTEYLAGIWDKSITKSNSEEGFYRQIWQEDPKKQRISHGFFFWTSSLDITAPWAVGSYYLTHGNKQYDDFDAKRKGTSALYMSQEGPVYTMQWEGYRKGIDDMRYLEKLEEMISELDKIKPEKSELIKKDLRDRLELFTWASGQGSWQNVSDAQTQATKKWIAKKIVEIDEELKKYKTVQLKQGFNTISVDKVPLDIFGEETIIPMAYNIDGQKQWSIFKNQERLTALTDVGYYIYNKANTGKEISLYRTNDTSQATLHKGWNLLANSQSSERKLSDFNYNYNGKNYNLEQLLVAKIAHSVIPVVTDEQATTADKAFTNYNFSLTKPIKIPPKKLFWFYIF